MLLFDEPLSNLDAKLRRRVREEIRELQQKLGLTVVYVTHDQEEALAVSDRIIVMDRAGSPRTARPRELYDAPVSAFVADFIGEANILPCEIVALDGSTADVRLGPMELKLPARGLAPGPARLAIRPDRLELGGVGALDGIVSKATYVGSHMEYVVETLAGALFVVSPAVEEGRATGDTVSISFGTVGPVLLPL